MLDRQADRIGGEDDGVRIPGANLLQRDRAAVSLRPDGGVVRDERGTRHLEDLGVDGACGRRREAVLALAVVDVRPPVLRDGGRLGPDVIEDGVGIGAHLIAQVRLAQRTTEKAEGVAGGTQ